MARYIRPMGILLCIVGLHLLFSPIITQIQFIPLVGYLLSWMTALAAFTFAVVVGLTLATLTMAVAWVFFKPLFGVPLLLITAQVGYIILFYDWGIIGSEEEITK